MLVFGAGTDYALLLISRYRDELRRQESRHAAMATALRRTAEAVLASATTVVLGLLTLLLSAFPTTRGLGLACAVGVVVAAAFALLVLPAALVLFGRWVFWPKVPRVGEPVTGRVRHRVAPGRRRRVARRARRRRSGGTLVLLALLAAGLRSVRLGLDQADQFLERPEAIAAAERLARVLPGRHQPTRPRSSPAPTAEQVLAAVAEIDGRRLRPGHGQRRRHRPRSTPCSTRPGQRRGRDVVHRRARPRSRRLRRAPTSAAPTPRRWTSGRPPPSDRLLILPLILLLVLGGAAPAAALGRGPAAAGATVVATYAAAWARRGGCSPAVFGFEAMDTGVPLLAFLFLVALGVDYNIFLVTRAREEAPSTAPAAACCAR